MLRRATSLREGHRDVKKSDVIASAAKQPLDGLVKPLGGCFAALAMTSLFLAMH